MNLDKLMEIEKRWSAMDVSAVVPQEDVEWLIQAVWELRAKLDEVESSRKAWVDEHDRKLKQLLDVQAKLETRVELALAATEEESCTTKK